MISIYFSFGKKLFCSFIDFKSAFDTVWRVGLWQKMQKSNVQGKVCKVVNLLFKTAENILLIHEFSVTPLYELGSDFDPLFLKIGINILIAIYLWKFYIFILKISTKIILMMETLT
jgi:hypothetical protein